MANGKHKDSLVWGLVLVVLGLLFLLDNLDVRFDVWRQLANFWPVLLIVWGAWKLFFGIKDAREAAGSQTSAKENK
jgi:hypothetical protein